MKFWEVGFDMDEFTRFCLAETEAEAKARFISWVAEYLDTAEEPSWEERVWAQDITNRWMPTDNTNAPERFIVMFEPFNCIPVYRSFQEHMKHVKELCMDMQKNKDDIIFCSCGAKNERGEWNSIIYCHKCGCML